MSDQNEYTVICCEGLRDIYHHFNWFSYTSYLGDKAHKVYCMPNLRGRDNKMERRVNYCPCCGTEIRDIKLKDEDFS